MSSLFFLSEKLLVKVALVCCFYLVHSMELFILQCDFNGWAIFPLTILWQSSCTVSFLLYFFSRLIILETPLLTRFWWQELLDLGEAVGTQSRGLSQEHISLLPVTKYKCGFFSRKRTRRERSDRNLSFLLSSCLKICGTLIYIWCNVMVSAYHSRSGYEIVCSNFVLLLEWIWS